ncbi:hypothetical protein LUZ60_007479 [Juncus effusus]|nr:hypothetical protein LUZ60_007479 [Juncus effusus]
MASSNSEPPIIEQVITEFFAKSFHIILQSRSPFVSSRNFNYNSAPLSPLSPSSSSPSSRQEWFHLDLKDCPAALENFDLWRQSNLEPLIIEILLVSKNPKSEKLLERWVVQYETRKSKTGTNTSSLYNKTYKGSIVLLRSLYTVVRLLPAYNLFREINSNGTVRAVSLSHRIVPFIDPLTRLEESEFGRFSISPIETPFGKLSVSVSYRLVLDKIGTEINTNLSTEFITDYVGSPKTDPLRRFQTGTGSVPICTGTRRHSCSSDPLRAVPVLVPSFPNPKSGIPLPLGQKGKKGVANLSNNENAVLVRCESAPAGRGKGQNRNLSSEDNKQLVRYGDLCTGTSLPKEISLKQDKICYIEGMSGSRLNSRVLQWDRYDDSDIRYHFAQDEGVIDAFNRKRSQAALVGELLRILKKAPNLRIGFGSENSDPNPSLTRSTRTVTDALQDLNVFTQIRNSILSQTDLKK